ncbi:MAG: tryptophan-rich sensory protein [Clostridiales bacterium]|nr:tryptophan-rich sensory protein [Clostridiales bacterium]
MKIQWKPLLICVAIPLAVGGLAALLSREGMNVFASLEKPPLSPPGWLFPVVWTILYVLMGIASYLVFTSGADRKTVGAALRVYGFQLAVNFLWPIFFFNFGWYLFSFVWLLLLLLLILVTFARFWKISVPAACLLIPYLIWVVFAGYLNLGVALLNA